MSNEHQMPESNEPKGINLFESDTPFTHQQEERIREIILEVIQKESIKGWGDKLS
ncbi:hypothetical protein MO767_21865 [Pseudomonas sp. UYIF39]|uniref:hypothetical protein n=1 Tax=Pseudomonas sp. UYIF39 TaxID=1630747 RepID=UPI00249DA4F6|nr:hypothetical protein [Pseudomonas sp. UYIF39]MDI3356974.1 hypothetical protein [Pseudomonas sp. UYIF39]